MLKVFILVNTQIGEAINVARALRRVPGVLSADPVFGVYDVIVEAQAADPKSMSQLVTVDIQGTPGVNQTLTCMAMDMET